MYPLSPHKSPFLLFFTFFFHHSPPIPRHTVQTPLRPSILFLSLSPNIFLYFLLHSYVCWSQLALFLPKPLTNPAKEIHPAPISIITQPARSPLRGSSSADLLHHDPVASIKNVGKDTQDRFHLSSLPLPSLSFLTFGFCLCLEKKFLGLLCG